MKIKKFYVQAIIMAFLLGCSSDDNSPAEAETEDTIPAFELIGEDECKPEIQPGSAF